MSILWYHGNYQENWILKCLMEPNQRITKCEQLDMYEWDYIDYGLPLDKFHVAFFNHNKQQADICVFKIISYIGEFIFGPHLIEWNAHLFWVSSLSTLKKEFFGINDRLSLEKSIYLLCTPCKKCIQLEIIRNKVLISPYSGEYPIFIYYSPKHFKIKFQSKEIQQAWNHLLKARKLAKEDWESLLTTFIQQT